MQDVLGYQDKRIVVTGAASGMGAATVTLMRNLGATVASAGGIRWQDNLEKYLLLVETDGSHGALRNNQIDVSEILGT